MKNPYLNSDGSFNLIDRFPGFRGKEKTKIILSYCFNCKHYNRYDNRRHSCKAFPKGIPKRVFENKVKHNRKLRDQVNNYMYESR